MCGIAGMSMHPSSKVNVRALAHALLSAIEYRGSDASGYAFVNGARTGTYKQAVPGSQLSLGDLPRRAQSVILHTRYATQGHQSDNRNNHPVLSPDGDLALVHNGVISNDYEFRPAANRPPRDDEFAGLAAVDSAVIPALIRKFGLKDAAAKLEGYAAIAYLDAKKADRRTLTLARIESSPVAWTWLADGSFVFASTQSLLAAALLDANLDFGHIFEMPEKTAIRVVDGVITSCDDDIEMEESWWAKARFSSATAGGHGNRATGYNQYGIGSTFGNIDFEDDSAVDNPNDDLGWQDNEYRAKVTTDPDEIAMAMMPETNGTGECRYVPGYGWVEMGDQSSNDVVGFYVELDDSSLEAYQTLAELEDGLDFLANLNLWENAPFPHAEPKLRWTNFVTDMGCITVSGNYESWIEDLGMIDQFESPATYNLDYIRDGLTNIMMHQAV